MKKPTLLHMSSLLTICNIQKVSAFHQPSNSVKCKETMVRLLSSLKPNDPDYFLSQVETTVRNVMSQHSESSTDILNIPQDQRESVGVARHLQKRLQGLRTNNDCPRCWMQQTHCICSKTPPLQAPKNLNRIFLILNHKEVAMKVDTAKLILAAFPEQCRLVVAGIGPEYQSSMKELLDSVQNNSKQCLVLYPDDDALTVSEISEQEESCGSSTHKSYDLIILDGTWAQARKIHARYIPSLQEGGPQRVQLSEKVVSSLETTERGHQLRRHSTSWRQVGTFEATRLFLKDWDEIYPCSQPAWESMTHYQDIANEAAKRELPPPREKQNVEYQK